LEIYALSGFLSVVLLESRFIKPFMLFFVSSAASTPTQQDEDSRAASIVSTNGTTLPISRKSRVGGYFLVIVDIASQLMDRVLANIDTICKTLPSLYLF
jgi:hypothetical protein